MPHATRIRILVLHDDPFARAGLAAIFARYPDLEVINTDEMLDGPASMPNLPTADVVVADYAHGVALATRGTHRPGGGDVCRIMVVASIVREWEVRSALQHGVRGYILFGCALDELACGVRNVYRGVRHLSAPVAQRLAESLSAEALTSREEEVLRHVVNGLSNKAIARRLNIAVGTVKSHLKGIFDKLGVDSRTQAICAAERRGLLSAPIAQTSVNATRDLGPGLAHAGFESHADRNSGARGTAGF